jgi:long-chain fatty acid transport protein
MQTRGALIAGALGLAVLGALAASPAFAAGFAINEQGAKATGMADAFIAQADDPSALYWNAGGLAFLDQRALSVGATYIRTLTADFSGANPFPGDGVTAKEKTLSVFPPHAYFVQPINQQWKAGLGIETPYGLTVEWQNPDTFAGRFLSTKSALRVFDINPTIAWQVTPEVGIGIGGIARISDVELRRDIGAVDPFTLRTATIASARLKGDFSEGYGFNLGVLVKPTSRFSLGLMYRSAIDIKYTGNGRLSQISTGDPIFDAVVAAQLPFGRDLPVATKIKMPAIAGAGLGVGVTPDFFVEVDAGWTGWKRFDSVPITFTNGDLPNSVRVERWKDAYNYRLGLRYTVNPVWQLRLGYVYDETPQPEQTVTPLLPDNRRNGYTIGIGFKGSVVTTDFSILYLDFGSRSRSKTFSDDPDGDFFGTYRTRALLAALTVTF